MVFFSRITFAVPIFTYNGTPLELPVTWFKNLGITPTRDGSMHTAAEKMAVRSAVAKGHRTGDSKGIKHIKYAMSGFSRSSLWQLVCMVAKYGPLLLTYDSSKSPLHTSFILAFWKDFWVSRKVLKPTACSAKQVRCPFFPIGSDASYNSRTVYFLQTCLLLRELCGLPFFLQTNVIHGFIRFCSTCYKIFLCLSNFGMPYDLASLSIWNSLSSLCTSILLGAGESLTIWHHMRLTIPAELWGLITHFLVYLWGLFLAGGMTVKNHKPMLPLYLRLEISNNLSRALSCLRLSGHKFLVQRMRHNRNRRPSGLRICDKCDKHRRPYGSQTSFCPITLQVLDLLNENCAGR